MLKRIRRSVRTKLLVLMLTTTLVALIVAVAALVVYDLRTYHERWVADLTTQAEYSAAPAWPPSPSTTGLQHEATSICSRRVRR